MNHLLCLAVMPMLACGCQTVAPAVSDAATPSMQQDAIPQPASDSAYRLAPGDQLEIIVHNAPELSRVVTIGPDGEIRIPYSGPIQAATETLETVKQSLLDALASELLHPDIDVLLVAAAAGQCGACEPKPINDR